MYKTEYAEGGAKLHNPPHQDRVNGIWVVGHPSPRDLENFKGMTMKFLPHVSTHEEAQNQKS